MKKECRHARHNSVTARIIWIICSSVRNIKNTVFLRRNSWKYNFVEVYGHNLEISQTWAFYSTFVIDFLHAIHEQTWVLFTDWFLCIDFCKNRGGIVFAYRFFSFRCISIFLLYGKDVFMVNPGLYEYDGCRSTYSMHWKMFCPPWGKFPTIGIFSYGKKFTLNLINKIYIILKVLIKSKKYPSWKTSLGRGTRCCSLTLQLVSMNILIVGLFCRNFIHIPSRKLQLLHAVVRCNANRSHSQPPRA